MFARGTHRLLLSLSLCLVFALAACGPEDGNNGTNNGNNGGNNGTCTNECDVLDAKQCDGTVIQTCLVDSNGCKVWESGVDCASADKICDETGQLAECVGGAGETCDDGQQNQDETDVDCGGSVCDPCDEGSSCEVADDCTTSNCDAGNTDQCVAEDTPTCTDGEQNQDETDVDCGGSSCDGCSSGQACTASSDCASQYCDTDAGECLSDAPTCDDDVQNQDETDVDCGGSNCPACPDGDMCSAPSDCESGNCDSADTGTCVSADTPTCGDGMQNQDETDVDCGGSTCSPCALGDSCDQGSDCTSGICDFLNTKTCIDPDPQYEVNEDFETGDFSLFPYTFTSSNDGVSGSDSHNWEIETDSANCHGGDYCMRSSSLHAEQETTTVSVSLSVRQDTQITFWAKTNTEVDQHYFRFYIDGDQKLELSGQNDWQLYSFDVPATGPNGPDRTFTWEYSRSDYIDPNHVPWNEVWVDDIDMPDWNTEPTVPETIRPWNGKLMTDLTPTFQWRSFDPDFDTITYEMQWDETPTFSDPESTGETNDTQFTPPSDLTDQTVYYWRVRAKDDSNYRWSDWSETWSIEVDSSYEYADVWRQSEQSQFELNDLSSAEYRNGGIRGAQNISTYNSSGGITMSFTNLPAPTTNTGTLTLDISGDFDYSREYADIIVEGQNVQRFNPSGCGGTVTLTINNLQSKLSDGQLDVQLNTSTQVDYPNCGLNSTSMTGTLEFNTGGAGSMTSVPINFNTFGNKQYWEKIQWTGSGDVTIQVLDEQGNLIPDDQIPLNSQGITSRTLRLWHLDPAQYPVIKLRAEFQPGGVLEEWRVVGNDVHEWLFSNDGDPEGWSAEDHLASPTWSVSGGVYRFESTASGDDPRIEYWFDDPIEASNFTTIEVRVRTSNLYNNDDVTLFWDSNYGQFDDRRSFTEADIFLQQFQSITYDLTVVPQSPQEEWRGRINAIRIDPVVRFKDQAGDFSDGWFEIERIAIY